MGRLLISALLLLALVAATAGAARDWRTDDRGVLMVIAKAPVKARSRKNPYEGQSDAILAGEKLFKQHCAECQPAFVTRTERDARRTRLVAPQRQSACGHAALGRDSRAAPLADHCLRQIPRHTGAMIFAPILGPDPTRFCALRAPLTEGHH